MKKKTASSLDCPATLSHENRYLDNRKVEYWGGELAQCDPSLKFPTISMTETDDHVT